MTELINNFDLPHTFVVYRSGASGTFVTKLLGILYDENRSDLIFSKEGHAHEATPAGGTWLNHTLNCGIGPVAEPYFADLKESVSYYRELIEASPWHYFHKHPGVTLTHIHRNIPLYKVLFPNSKILVITCDTIEEKAVSLLQMILKYMIGGPPETGGYSDGYSEWLSKIHSRILTHIGQQHIDIADVIINDKHTDILLYFTLIQAFAVFRSGENILKNILSSDLIGIKDLENCTILPYSCIINGDSELFLQIIESIHGIKFTDSQNECALRNFKRYHASQNQSILSDPMEFFKQLEIRAMSQLNSMMGKN